MNQVLTSKEEIAELLYTHTTAEFPSKVINEILSRIADEKVSTKSVYSPYNHKESNIFAACGVDEDSVHTLAEMLNKFAKDDKVTTTSEIIEFLENSDSSRREICFLVGNIQRRARAAEEKLEAQTLMLNALMERFFGGKNE